jgi:HD superfamily phosphodiesterase
MGRRLIKDLTPEIDKIKSEELKRITKKILLNCCDYCVDEGASSTGQYHPEFSQGKGGLIRHIKAVCRNVETILLTMPQYDGEDWDIPYIAAILHDCMKYTEYNQKYSNENHPNLIASTIRKYKTNDEILNKKLERIANNAETHMARWNKCKHSGEEMPLPSSVENLIVSIGDMIAAQKWFDAKFDENNYII